MRFPRSVGLSIAVAGAIAVWVATSAASPVQTARTNRAIAAVTAQAMLTHLVLPPGATQIRSAPKSTTDLLARPYEAFLIASQVDRHAFWTTKSSAQTTIASIEAHLPARAVLVDHGYAGYELLATYSFPTVHRGSLGARQLVLEVLGQSSGDTVVRADAEVRYVAPRPYDERIPAAARVVEVTVGSNLPRHLLSLIVTNKADVRQIARIADSLPFVGNGTGAVYSCPAFSGTFPVDRFIFRHTITGLALASISELAATPTEDYPCLTTSLVIRGHHERNLQDGGILLKQAGALLHVRLAR